MDKSDYYVFFSYAVGIGPKTFLRLLSRFDSAEKIYNASEKELESAGFKGKTLEKYLKFKSGFALKKILFEIKQKNIWVITYADFPQGLKNIANPPIVLYGRGDGNLVLKENGIGIVGSRRPTSYGVSVTEKFTAELVESGLTIISGMALGIDGIAHRECLKKGGKTIAVLGSGVDLPTPGEHTNLYQEIIKNGGAVISEFPIGMQPTKGSFPARNRIISALSEAILIPEATSDSGALITAKEAFSQGKKVFVVPGPITSSLSRGTNSLLSHGGIAVSGAVDVLNELNFKRLDIRPKVKTLDLGIDEEKIMELLEVEPCIVDRLSKELKISAGKIIVILSGLELRDIVENVDGKWQIKN